AVEQGLGGDSEAGARGRVALSDADLEPAAQVRVWPLERGVTRGSPTDASFPLWVILMASLTLTRRGQLLFTAAAGPLQPPGALLRRLERAFGRGSGHGLFELGAAEVGTALPADFSYWRDFAARLATAICTHPDLDAHHAPIPAPALTELE